MMAARTATAHFVLGSRSADAQERTEAALVLGRWVQNAFGLEAEAFGAEMRRSGALACVLRLLYDESEPRQMCLGLMLVGNLACESFDPKAQETVKLVLRAEAFPRLKALLFASDEMLVSHACGALQNLSAHGHVAKLVVQFEIEKELERLVHESGDRQTREAAAGTLSNVLEAMQRAMMASSLDRTEAGAVTGVTGGGVAEVGGSVRRGRAGMLASAFGEKPPELELSEEVLETLAGSEAVRARIQAEREEAARLIQAIMRRRKSRAAFRMLKRLSSAVLLVIRWVRRRRRRKQRRAALVIQAHFRAGLCQKLQICSYAALLCAVYGLRAMHNRAVCRSVYGRYPHLRPEGVVLPGLPEAVRKRDRRQRRSRLLESFRPFRWRRELRGVLASPASLTARIGVQRPQVAPLQSRPPRQSRAVSALVRTSS
jgi:hypothetical protein